MDWLLGFPNAVQRLTFPLAWIFWTRWIISAYVDEGTTLHLICIAPFLKDAERRMPVVAIREAQTVKFLVTEQGGRLFS